MYSILQTRYQRVERALDSLLDSITAYNPSLGAADELAAADESVNEALDQLSNHHANYARILSLRATSAALDAQLKSTLTSLAATRSTLKSISLAAPSTTTNPVAVDALLSYAKFISKTTVPPTRRGQQTLAAQTQTQATTPATAEIKAEDEPDAVPETSEAMRRVLPPEVKGQFIPWPGHDVIQRGGLAAVQAMREAGTDPATATTAQVIKAEEEVKAAAEERAAVAEEEARPPVAVEQHHVPRQREEDEFDPDEM